MPLLRASAIIALIFAFSPVREGATTRDAEAPPAAESTMRESAASESPEPVRDAPTADLERARALWKALPEEARAELAERVAQELSRSISP
jgi:hypothetical protein